MNVDGPGVILIYNVECLSKAPSISPVKKSPESTAIIVKLLLGLILSSKKFKSKQKLTQQNSPNFST